MQTCSTCAYALKGRRHGGPGHRRCDNKYSKKRAQVVKSNGTCLGAHGWQKKRIW